LDFAPSPAAQLVAKLPSAILATDTKWLWRISLVIGVPVLVLAAYLLSQGPILRLYGAKPSSISRRVPAPVRMLYQPLDRMPMPLGRLLRRYNLWWMDVEHDKREVRKLVARIDTSITNGMERSDVIKLLGQPAGWFTNAGGVQALYMYWPEVATSGRIYGAYMTNGFNIWFSNGLVLSKSPITVERE
jgi:hypothetical protein